MCELRKSDGNSSTSLHPDHSATAATSALGLRSPQPDLHLDSTHHPQNINCIGTELTPLASALRLGSSLPHLHRDSARCPPHLHRDWAHPPHICTWTGLAHATSAPGLPGLTPATSAPGLGSPLPHLHRDWAHLGKSALYSLCTMVLRLFRTPTSCALSSAKSTSGCDHTSGVS